MTRSPLSLERFLTRTDAPLPDLAQVRAFRLGGYAYTRLGADHPAKATLQRDFLSDTALHQQVVRDLHPLLRAWRAAGVDVLVFKGFYLAEFVYDAPAQRYYVDVDLLIPDAQIALASGVARGLGWLEPWSATTSDNDYSHEALHLESPNGVISLDVHRLVVHSYLPWHPTQTRLTEAAWANATTLTWQGVTLKTLAPEDALIVGLALNRAWSTDAWRLRPRDYLDARYLVDRFGLTRDALERRADTLVCRRTLARFLDRCDPFRSRVKLAPPSRTRRWRLAVETLLERRPSTLERSLLPLLLAPHVLSDMVAALPSVVAAWRLRRTYPHDLERIVTALLERPPRPPRSAFRVVRGAFWLVKGLEYGGLAAQNTLFALATFAALRQHGYDATLVAGQVKTKQIETSQNNTSQNNTEHAAKHRTLWVTLQGQIVAKMQPGGGTYLYRAEDCYPSSS